jgi:hypothetical protein
MTARGDDGLDPAARALLDAVRPELGPDPAAIARIRARVGAVVVAGAAAAIGAGHGAASAASAGATGAIGATGVVAGTTGATSATAATAAVVAAGSGAAVTSGVLVGTAAVAVAAIAAIAGGLALRSPAASPRAAQVEEVATRRAATPDRAERPTRPTSATPSTEAASPADVPSEAPTQGPGGPGALVVGPGVTTDPGAPAAGPGNQVAAAASRPGLPASSPAKATKVAAKAPAAATPALRGDALLTREVALVDAAMDALRRGAPQAALAALVPYAREIGARGQLAEEATAIDVEARCLLDDPDAAARLAAFAARWPRSAQHARLVAACPGVTAP